VSWRDAAAGAEAIGELPERADLTHDSRRVGPGVGFAALPGQRVDGHDFLGEAVAAGAAFLVVQRNRESKWRPFAGRAPLLVVEDARAALGPLAAALHGNPSRRLRMVGVTGTDGKTTTIHLTAHVLSAAGLPCGYLSSVGFDTGAGPRLNLTHMTTPEATDVQRSLAEAVSAGLEGVVVEASSEGLARARLSGCEFDVAVFRNLSRDHLDFHGSMEAYREAKGLLFEMLEASRSKPYPKAAVLNADDAASTYMAALVSCRRIAYGFGQEAEVRCLKSDREDLRLRLTIAAMGDSAEATAPLMDVHNALAAVAVAISQGAQPRAAIAALRSFPGVPGRYEAIDCGQAFRVIVDIASTPAALEHVLETLRRATPGRLWAVFGAAGGRDPARREGMGRVAGRLADRAVLTNEDPRDEDPEAIIEAIAAGLRAEGREEGRDFVRVLDRREAIAHAFAHAGPGDTVLLAGKATEPTMVFGREERPWDERAVARALLGG
jgi:UDP-N-acetylmuramoyl-L-alanyl-D-glutamate--2,6-diaminopimelate ligase